MLSFISIVIPYYNAERNISEICDAIIKAIKQDIKQYEIIIIDDCSEKEMNAAEHKYFSEKQNIYVERLSINKGQNYATGYGITKATGDIIITIDDDLVYSQEFFLEILHQFILRKVDVLYCIRKENKQYSFIRKMLQNIIKKAYWLLSNIQTSSIRVFSSKIKNQVSIQINQKGFSLDKIIYKGKNKIDFLNIDIESIGKTRYSFTKLATVLIQFLRFK